MVFQARGCSVGSTNFSVKTEPPVIANVILEELQPETPPVKENNGCSVNRECSLMKLLEGV